MALELDGGVPAPQVYESDGITPMRLKGQNGAGYFVIFGADGSTVASSSNRLPVEAQLSGSTPAGDDVTGTGNDAAVDLGVSVNYVDFYNGGAATATISDGTETRNVPAGSGRICYFTTAAQTYAVVADGDWIATPMQ